MSQQQSKRKTQEDLARAQMLRGYRLAVEDEELLARMNRASYEKMYYFVEATKLIPEYKELIEVQEALRKEQEQSANFAATTAYGALSAEPTPTETPTPEAEVPSATVVLGEPETADAIAVD